MPKYTPGRLREAVNSRRITARLRVPSHVPSLLIIGAGVHPESAPVEVEDALRFIGDELRGDLEEAAARIDDDAGFAQDGELPWVKAEG